MMARHKIALVGAGQIGGTLALLAAQMHARQSSAAYADLVAAAEVELGADAPPQRRRNLQLLRLELERQRCLDPALVSALARAQSRGNAVWQDARARNDFAAFAPALKELIALRRQHTCHLCGDHPQITTLVDAEQATCDLAARP
jgi:carboxypeptidase Taq